MASRGGGQLKRVKKLELEDLENGKWGGAHVIGIIEAGTMTMQQNPEL